MVSGELSGRVALITGAARGIGQATAHVLASRGCHVVIADADEVQARVVAGKLATAGLVWAGDLVAKGAAEQLVESAVKAFGRLDIVVNGAGYSRNARIEDMSQDQFQEMLDIHLIAPWAILRAAAPFLQQSGAGPLGDRSGPAAKVVNVASMSAYGMGNGQTNYSAAKAGLIGLTKSLAQEWSGRNICVNAVAPGLIDTRLTRPATDETVALIGGRTVPFGLSERAVNALHARVSKTTPIGRFGRAEEVGATIGFLCSPACDYISGQVLNISGGVATGMSS